MARTTRVELNRKAMGQVVLAMADGLFAFAQEVIAASHPSDAPPYGQGLVEGGGAIAYVGKKKVAGTTIGGMAIKKPRQFRTREGEASAIAGFGFPARFLELGTVDTRAQPFLTSGVAQVAPNAEVIVSPAIKRRLAGMRA